MLFRSQVCYLWAGCDPEGVEGVASCRALPPPRARSRGSSSLKNTDLRQREGGCPAHQSELWGGAGCSISLPQVGLGLLPASSLRILPSFLLRPTPLKRIKTPELVRRSPSRARPDRATQGLSEREGRDLLRNLCPEKQEDGNRAKDQAAQERAVSGGAVWGWGGVIDRKSTRLNSSH